MDIYLVKSSTALLTLMNDGRLFLPFLQRSCSNHRIIRLNYNKLICCLPASQMFRKTHFVLHISCVYGIALYAIVSHYSWPRMMVIGIADELFFSALPVKSINDGGVLSSTPSLSPAVCRVYVCF